MRILDPLNNLREQVYFLNNDGIPNQSQVLISHQSLNNRREQLYYFNNNVTTNPLNCIPNHPKIIYNQSQIISNQSQMISNQPQIISNETFNNRKEQFYFSNNDAMNHPVNCISNQPQIKMISNQPLNNRGE